MSTLERTIGYTSAIGEVTRESGSVIGNSLKSIMSRITSIPGAIDALDEIGISVKDSAGEMREFDDIIDDLGAQWEGLSKEQQQNLGLQIAGRYQLSRFLIMMERYDDAMEAANTATNSNGSAMRENERYLDSYEAKINHMKNAWTETTIAMQEGFLGDAMLGFSESGTSLLNMLTQIVSKIGILPPAFSLVGLAAYKFRNEIAGFVTSSGAGRSYQASLDKISNSAEYMAIKTNQGEKAARNYARNASIASAASNTFANSLKSIGRAAIPMLAFAAIGYGISLVTQKMMENKQAADELRQELDELDKSREKAVTENKDEVEGLLEEFYSMKNSRPSNGFEDNDKENEYLQIQNELADLFPSIVEHVDSKGQAHLKAKDAIEEEIEASNELAKTNRELRVEKAKDKFKDINNEIKDMEKQIKLIEGYTSQAEAWDNQPKISKVIGAPMDWIQEKTLMGGFSHKDIADSGDTMVRLEELKIEEQARQMREAVASIFDDMTFDIQEKSPEITEGIRDIFSSLDFDGLNEEEIYEKTLLLKNFAEELSALYGENDAQGFNAKVTELEGFLEGMNVEDIDSLIFSYSDLQKIKDENIAVADYLAGVLGEEEKGHEDASEAVQGHVDANGELIDSEESLADSYNNSISAIEQLNGFLNEIDEGGLSAQSISDIMENYHEFLPLLEDEIYLREAIEEAIDSQAQTAEDAIFEQMLDSKNFFDFQVDNNTELYQFLSGLYEGDLSGFKSLASAKGAVESQLINKLAGAWAQYYDDVSNTFNMAGSGLSPMAAGPEAIAEMDAATASVRELRDKMKNITVGSINTDFSGIGASIKDAGRSADKAGNSTKGAGDKAKKAGEDASGAAKETAKEHKLSAYVADAYTQALEKVNFQLEEQNSITSKFPKHSKEYRNSLAEEIKLLKSKEDILKRQTKDLQQQIKSGNIKQTGIVDAGSIWETVVSGGGSSSSGGGSSKSIASYYLDQFRVSSGFGGRNSPGGIGSTNHKGVDFSNGRAGDPVKALASGKVISAAYSSSAGNMVVIQQDDGLVSKYMHMQNGLRVKSGQRVDAGTVLGGVGTTGNSTGNHLHLQLERNGTPFDPLPYLKQIKSGGDGSTTSSSAPASSAPSQAQKQADASKVAAEQAQSIDKANSDLLGMQKEMLSVADEIEDLYFAIVESHLEEFDHNRDVLNKKLAEIDYYQTRYDEGSNDWAKQQIEREKVIREQNKIHKDSIEFIEKEIKSNKNLTKAQRMRLDDMLIERQTEMWNLERQILDERISMAEKLMQTYKDALTAQKDAALKAVDDMLKEIDEKEREADYKKRRQKQDKERQEILDEISKWSIDGSDAAKKRIKELTEQLQEMDEEIEETQHDKAIEDRKESLNEEKETISENYDNLVNDEKKFADMRSKIIKGNTKSIGKELDSFYKKIGKMTDALGKSTVNNLQRAIKQMNTYIKDPNFKDVKIPHFDTGGRVRASSSGGGLIVAHDKEIVLDEKDSANLLQAVKMNKNLLSGFKTPKIPELAANNNSGNSILYDIDLHIESMNGTKQDANNILNRLVKGIESKGGRFN